MGQEKAELLYEIGRFELEHQILRSLRERLKDRKMFYAADYTGEAAELLTKAMVCLKLATKHMDPQPFEQLEMRLPEDDC